jgi:hypothetical protein
MSTDTEIMCSICLIIITDTSKNIIKTECEHIFHSNCFLKNVAFNGFDCPNCRNVLANIPKKDNDEDDDDDDDDDYNDYTNDEDELYLLNGYRWLFMRAEGEPIDITDDDNYDEYIRDPQPSALNISIGEIAEKIIERGVTYNQLVALLVLPDRRNPSDLAEYNGSKLYSLDNMIYNIIHANIN